MSAASVSVSTAPVHGAGPGSTPRAALHSLWVAPVPVKIAKGLIVQHHYLHSLPGGTQLAFGVFLGGRLLGVVVLGFFEWGWKKFCGSGGSRNSELLGTRKLGNSGNFVIVRICSNLFEFFEFV